MKEFLMILRAPEMDNYKPSDEQMETTFNKWKAWIRNIAGQGKLVRTNQTGTDSKIVDSKNNVANAHYVKDKELVTGFMILKAASSEEAAELAKNCPIFDIGGQIEIRNIQTNG